MVGGVCGVRGDVIPFGLVNGQYASLEGLNIIGMKRRKFTRERLATVRSFYQKLFHGPGIFAERLSAVQPLAATDPAIAEILAFIDDGKHRALCLPADDGNSLTTGHRRNHDDSGSGNFLAVGLIAAGGVMPFAVADSLLARGIDPVLFALKGACDPVAVARFRHHWISVGQLGRAMKLFRAENCRDLIFIGTLVRPALSEIRLDWGTLRVLGRVWAAFRGGDDHLLVRHRPHSRAGRLSDGGNQGCRPGSADARRMPHPAPRRTRTPRPISRGDARCCVRSAPSTSARPRS